MSVLLKEVNLWLFLFDNLYHISIISLKDFFLNCSEPVKIIEFESGHADMFVRVCFDWLYGYFDNATSINKLPKPPICALNETG